MSLSFISIYHIGNGKLQGSFLYDFTSIPVFISNRMFSEVRDENTYPFQNFKGVDR